jgi:DNA replicative helicase MCM subunit Mcm2 (Cdc46/Mcm family)
MSYISIFKATISAFAVFEGQMSGSDSSQSDDHDENDNPTSQWNAARLHQSSYKDLGTPTQVEERFTRHLRQHCHADLKQLLQESSVTTRDYSVCIDTFDLIQADPVLGVMLIRYPATLLPLLEAAIVRAQHELLQQRLQESEPAETTTQMDTIASLPWSVKGAMSGVDQQSTTTRVHARLVHLPPTCCKPSLGRSLAAEDVGKIWQVSGTVVRTGSVQMYESARTYRCCGVNLSSSGGWRGGRGGGRGGRRGDSNTRQQEQPYCGRTFLVHADVEQRNNALQDPVMCPGTLPNGDRCPANMFSVVEGGSVHTDYQEIKIQDAASSNAGGVGHIPRSLLIKLQHDLVDHCQPGDEVVIVGILLAQWHNPAISEGMECQVSMAMSAHSVRVICEKSSSAWKGGTSSGSSGSNSVGERDRFENEFLDYWTEPDNIRYPIAARDFICKAVCPKLYGMQVIKLALLITLIGGVSSDAYEGNGDDDSIEIEATSQEGSLRSRRRSRTVTHNGPDQFELVREVSNQKTSSAYYDDTSTVPNTQTTSKPEKVKTRRRDQSHILLVGDPGT